MTVFPIYVLADRSASMAAPAGSGTAIDVVNAVIADLLTELSRDPIICLAVRFAVLSFADNATVDLPLTQLSSRTRCPRLVASGRTSFTEAFETAARAIRVDSTRLRDVQDPMIFMMTDGNPNADRDARDGWLGAHRDLLGSAGAGRGVRLVPFGFGRVNTQVISRIASDPSMAYLAAATDTPAQAIARFAELIFASVTSSVANGEPRTVPPQGSRNVVFNEEPW